MKTAGRAVINWLRAYGLGIALFVGIAIGIVGGINSTERVSGDEKKRMLEDNVRRAIIACYTLEGAYPMNLDYLTENYNLSYDKEEFVIHYTVFGSNMFPDYDIMERSE